jgi:hypothetical protein
MPQRPYPYLNFYNAVSMRLFSHFYLKTPMNTAPITLRKVYKASLHTMMVMCLCTIVMQPQNAWAQTTEQNINSTSHWWITPGAVSYHYENRDQFNQTHPGFGIEYHPNNQWAFVAGTYKNSNYRWSDYGGVNWTPAWLQFGLFKLGATAQVANNYPEARNGKPFAFAAPLIAVEGKHVGANIYIIPTVFDVTGAVALQLKFGF